MRRPTADDLEQVLRLLLRLKASSKAAQMALCEEAPARQHLAWARDTGFAVIHDGYFLLIDIGSPWHTTKRVLFEELVLRIGETEQGPRGAVRALEELARTHGCAAVAAGDTQVRAMTPHYLAEGFTPLGDQLFKEISNGEGPKADGSASGD